MTNMTCTIDRIRETQVSSRHGLPANLTEILTNFYKDDVLQPKPSPKLRLQEYYIKTLLQQLSIDKNSSAQMVMLDIMIDCNRLHLLKWSEKLEILTYQRGIVQGDLHRFENNLNSQEKWLRFLTPQPQLPSHEQEETK